jgi:protein SCO1/2
VLAAAAATLAAPALAQGRAPKVDEREAARSSHFPFGPVVPPRALERWAVTTHRGVATDLPALLRGRFTAVQLMFTGCSATCPIQGALFAEAQRLVGGAAFAPQFLSVSIDALGDTPARLATWLQGFGAGPQWLAALPRVADVDAIVERLGSGGEKRPPGPDPHTGQVYLFDRKAELVLRTPSMPTPAQIADALRQVAARG